MLYQSSAPPLCIGLKPSKSRVLTSFILLTQVMDSEAEEHRSLRAKATECVGVIAGSIGKERFHPAEFFPPGIFQTRSSEHNKNTNLNTGEGKTSAGNTSCGEYSVPNFGTVFFWIFLRIGAEIFPSRFSPFRSGVPTFQSK